jgi:C4-dicarboxylate transporter DctM subunit
MMGWLIFGSFFVLMLIGVPIGLSIALSSLAVFLASGIPLQLVPPNPPGGKQFVLPGGGAVLVLAGDILARGGISERIVAFAESLLGRTRGGLSIVSVLASMFISAISGSGAPPRPPSARRCCRT